uniref:Coiled-coil domain-containing protein 22 n=1 Tax=Oryzias latipes TaxID=8090 RepID=A0A3P9JG02_ORYLA
MEEVDRILIHALRQVGTEVDEDVDSIRQFTSELLVEGVVRCIRVIDPGLGGGLAPSLPPGMSARFRVGMSLAQACQDVGYKGEIGYQTFLYSSEPEIRSLLMFLVEKLPRESAEASAQPSGKSAVLQRAIAAAIRAQLDLAWVPPNCSLPLHCETQSGGLLNSFYTQPLSSPHCTKGSEENLKEVKEYHRDVLPPVTAQFSSSASMVASLLEQHAAELSAAQEWDGEWKSQGLLSRLTPQASRPALCYMFLWVLCAPPVSADFSWCDVQQEYRSRKLARLQKRIQEQLRSAAQPSSESAFGVSRPASDLMDVLQSFRASAPTEHVLMKGTHFTHTQKFTFTQEAAAAAAVTPILSARESGGDVQLRQQEELSALQAQFQQLCSDVDHLAADMRHTAVTHAQVLDELKQRELGNTEKEEKLQVKKKTIDLLPEADNNVVQLQSLVEASAKRVVNLASQWEKRRAPLIDEHRRLKEICSRQDLDSSRKLSEIKSLHEKIHVSTEEAKKKEETYKQLLTELESLPQDASRSAYTQRILEIVSNIKKQKEEITKILSDTRELQKEINSLTGKLDRTFAVTDELVFKDAKKDESVRKSYKYLAALHENCNQLIQTIEDTGTILREIRDLEEQVGHPPPLWFCWEDSSSL